jgi:molybdopterin molybdotransferase
VALPAGLRLGPGDLAVAAACGAAPLTVRPRPRACVLSTGDEVVRWTAAPAPHQVRDSNRVAAAARLVALGAELVAQQHVPDDEAQLREALARALEAADLTVTIGGVSMGQKDLLPRVLEGLGVREVLHGVAIQPGKPVWIGRRDERWVLGLPGNPVSAFVTLELFGRPLLDALHGLPVPDPYALCPGIAAEALRAKGRELWLPARCQRSVEGPPRLAALPWTGSGDWTCLAGADALVHLPAGTEVAAGAPVRYLPLGA